MAELSSLSVFAAAALALTSIPGPDMLLIASRSVSQGRSAGFLTYAGIATGTYCHALAAALGLSQLFVAVPVAYEIVRWAGCLYLLYLAYRTVTSRSASFAPDTNMPRIAARRIFFAGVGTNLLNPKMALFVLALFPQFVSPGGRGIVSQMLLLATILNVIGLGVNGTVILLSAHIRSRLAGFSRFPKLPQYALAAVFTALAGRVAWSGAQR